MMTLEPRDCIRVTVEDLNISVVETTEDDS